MKDSIEKAWECVLSNVRTLEIQGSKVCYFPLFFQETQIRQPSEIDLCATAIGLSILSSKPSLKPNEIDILRKCCKLLIMIQERSGGWPSIVPLKAIKTENMEGTINDTVFALKALFDAGLPSFQTDIIDVPIAKQLQIIRDGIRWLLRNRIRQAWYYVEKEFIMQEDLDSITPMTLPTCNVILLFSQARKIIRKFNEELKKHVEVDYNIQIKENEKLLLEIDTAYSEALEWLRTVQNLDGGYGKCQGDNSRITNTVLALKALLTDDTKESMEKAKRALQKLLKTKFKELKNPSNNDIFENYYQIWVCKENNSVTYVRRPIVHEKYAIALLVQVLAEASNKEWIIGQRKEKLVNRLNFVDRVKYKILLNRCIKRLLELQEQSGKLSGAFKGYRYTPMTHPIYAIQNSIDAFFASLKNYDAFKLVRKKSLLAGFLIILASLLLIWSVGVYLLPELWQEILLTIIMAAILYGTNKIFHAFKE